MSETRRCLQVLYILHHINMDGKSIQNKSFTDKLLYLFVNSSMTLQQTGSDLVRHNSKYDAFMFHKSKEKGNVAFLLIQRVQSSSWFWRVLTYQSASVSHRSLSEIRQHDNHTQHDFFCLCMTVKLGHNDIQSLMSVSRVTLYQISSFGS